MCEQIRGVCAPDLLLSGAVCVRQHRPDGQLLVTRRFLTLGPCCSLTHANTHPMQTPGSWPAASEFPNGQPLKRPTTDYWFNRESTLGETAQQRPKSALPERLARTLEKEKTMLIQLSSTVHKERMEVTVKRPGSAPVMRHKKNIITKQPAIQQVSTHTTHSHFTHTHLWSRTGGNVDRERSACVDRGGEKMRGKSPSNTGSERQQTRTADTASPLGSHC